MGGVVYEVVGKWETRKSDDIQLEGANASAEEADEGTETTSQTGIDIVLNHRLTETGFGKKGEYATYLKGYMKNVVKKLEEAGKNDQVEESGCQKWPPRPNSYTRGRQPPTAYDS